MYYFAALLKSSNDKYLPLQLKEDKLTLQPRVLPMPQAKISEKLCGEIRYCLQIIPLNDK